jgi:hypothetical protein
VSGTTLYVGGNFTSMSGGTVRNYLASFDTTTGNLTAWNPNASNFVTALAANGTTLYVGGNFTSMNGGTVRNYLASFDTTTGNLTAWNPNLDNSVEALAASGTTLYVGGWFTTMNGGTTRNYLASFDTTTGDLNAWNPNAWNPLMSTPVKAFAVSGSTLYVGGGFKEAGGGSSYFAPIDTTTGLWLPGH